MSKETDKFNRNFSNFGKYPYPGKNLPKYYDHCEDAGDGSPGLQYMIQKAISAYGPYHVIEDCTLTINGTKVTGSTGFVMYDGSIIKVPSEGRQTLSVGEYLRINSNGSYSKSSTPSGVLIAHNSGGAVYHVARRESSNDSHFPKDAYIYGKIVASKIEAPGDTITLNDHLHLGAHNITIADGYTIDGLDISEHDHQGGGGGPIAHDDLAGVTANQHIDNLTDIPTRSHASLQGVTSSQHHTKTTSSEIDHNQTTNYAASRHYLQSQMSLGNLGTRNHSQLNSIGQNDHHRPTKLTSTPINGVISTGLTSNWGYDHETNPNIHHRPTALTSTPANGVTTTGLTSDWGYDHENASNPHSVTLDQAFDQGRIIDGAITSYRFAVGSSQSSIAIWGDSLDTYLYQSNSTTELERGYLGYDNGTVKPFKAGYIQTLYTDDGAVSEYSEVDDLQLLREIKTYSKEKTVNSKYPEYKQKVFDMNTLPWVKADPNVNKIADDDNEKRYSISYGQKIGYLLSTIQKILLRQDELLERIKNLEKK